MFLPDKKLYLLDMDGTLYIDEVLFEHVREFLSLIRTRGGRYLFLTNNSSRGVNGYLEKLSRLGIPASAEDFVTSADATVRVLKEEYPASHVYVVGTASLFSQLKQAGLSVTDTLSDDVDLLLVGFDRELTYAKLEDACRLLARGADYLATNPDWVCPASFGSVPDCGSICEMLAHASGRTPRFIGKPQPDMVRLALARTGFSSEEAVLIGDRLYTDIACGENAGIDTVFVLSGEGTLADIEKYPVHPTAVYPSVGDIYKELVRSSS